MPSILYDVAHWLERAENARLRAARMSHAGTKELILNIAADYDQLAALVKEQAEIRQQHSFSD